MYLLGHSVFGGARVVKQVPKHLVLVPLEGPKISPMRIT